VRAGKPRPYHANALIESKVAKIDKKTGKLKVRKLGVAKAAIRPRQTVRQAMDGAALGDSSPSSTPAATSGHNASASSTANPPRKRQSPEHATGGRDQTGRPRRESTQCARQLHTAQAISHAIRPISPLLPISATLDRWVK
jgi:hypothetical protein